MPFLFFTSTFTNNCWLLHYTIPFFTWVLLLHPPPLILLGSFNYQKTTDILWDHFMFWLRGGWSIQIINKQPIASKLFSRCTWHLSQGLTNPWQISNTSKMDLEMKDVRYFFQIIMLATLATSSGTSWYSVCIHFDSLCRLRTGLEAAI